jgi:hypothetical protein
MLKRIVLLLSVAFIGVLAQSTPVRAGKFEISFHIGYSNPLLEARGDNLTIDSAGTIHIKGKRLLVSDNLATKAGYNVQAFLKYNFTKKGHVKGLFSLSYNMLLGIYDEFSGTSPGIRIQTFSTGIGAEVNPIGHDKKVYPSIYGLFKLNLVGGETFYLAGLDFFKVTSRFGYTAGLNLNFNIKKNIGIYTGYNYSYDNPIGRETADTFEPDPFGHAIPFRDEASAANGLSGNRRIAYWSLYLGMNFFF